MSRFFFDIVARHSRNYDFHGKYLTNSSEAQQMAEILALDLGISEEETWLGAEVQVRDERGAHILSLPVASSNAAIGV
jgi:hypothetical protein